MIVGQEKPSLEELRHFGIKGMRWGVRRKSQASAASSSRSSRGLVEPERPRATTTKAHGRQETREEQLVSRAINQGYTRAVSPALTTFAMNAPKRNKSSDPKVEALLNRSYQNAANSIEAEAGRAYIQGLPAVYRR